MIEIGLFDGSFTGQASMNMRGDNIRKAPKYIHWREDEHMPTTVFTDMYLFGIDAAEFDPFYRGGPNRKIAWILEPDLLDGLGNDEFVTINESYDYVLSSNRRYTDTFERWLYVPVGGLWVQSGLIGNRACYKFGNAISMVTTQKQKAPGHRFRTKIMETYHGLDAPDFAIEFFGRGSTPVERKIEALGKYRYSVVVESHQIPGYFTEKIIDCFAALTIPIYWGDPLIKTRFCGGGILVFHDIDSLFEIAGSVSEYSYKQFYPQVMMNYELAKRYHCAEDWMMENYPYLWS